MKKMMKKITLIAFLVPVLIFGAILDGRLDQVAFADPGVRGGGGRGGGGSVGRGGGGYVGRGGGGYVGRGGGGYVGHGGHGHGGGHFSGSIWIGPGWGFWDPFFYPYYSYPYSSYYSYPYYAPPTVVVPQEPQQYILQTPQPEETHYWYYCKDKDAKGYYPDVKRCPGGWMRVVPSPSPPDQELEQQEED